MKHLLTALLLTLSFGLTAMAAEPVDINTADAATLAESLNGVGQSKAEAIVEYREAHGPFEHADELVNVKGIGLRTVDRNRERIQLPEKESDS